MSTVPKTILRIYAVFLIVCGIAGTAIGPDHAKTAVAAGMIGGIGVLWLTQQATTKAQWASTGLRTILGVFALTFVWRAANAWISVAGGNESVAPVAMLLSLMFVVTVVVALRVQRIGIASQSSSKL